MNVKRSQAELCADLTNAYHALQAAFAELDAALQEEARFPAWVQDTKSLEGAAARQAIRRSVRGIDFDEAQAGNTTHSLVGVIAISPATRECVLRLNRAKDDFRKAKLAADRITVEVYQGREILPEEKRPGMRTRQMPLSQFQIRYRIGHRHIHLIQAWRHVPLADLRHFAPARVSFSWARVDRVARVPVEQVRRQLEERGGGAGICDALRRIEKIPDGEILAEVKPAPLHLRANVAWVDAPRQYARKQYATPLPLFYVCDRHQREPTITWPKSAALRHGRPRRLDAKIEREPLLHDLGIHRYMPEFREQYN